MDERESGQFDGIAATLGAFGAGYLQWTHAPVFEFLVEFQRKAVGFPGGYYPTLALGLAFGLPLAGVGRLLEWKLRTVNLPVPRTPSALRLWRFVSDRSAAAIFAGLMIFVVGAWAWSEGAKLSNPMPFSIADAERGVRPMSRFVRISDAVRGDHEVTLDGVRYLPLLSAEANRILATPCVLVRPEAQPHQAGRPTSEELPPADAPQTTLPTLQGIIEVGAPKTKAGRDVGETAEVRTFHYVLDTRFDPSINLRRAQWVTFTGFVLAFLSLAWAWRRGAFANNKV
jgi:hypothetical protein